MGLAWEARLVCRGAMIDGPLEAFCGEYLLQQPHLRKLLRGEDVWRRIHAVSTISDEPKEDGTLARMRRSSGLALP